MGPHVRDPLHAGVTWGICLGSAPPLKREGIISCITYTDAASGCGESPDAQA